MENRRFKLIAVGVVAAILIVAVIGIHFLAPRSETDRETVAEMEQRAQHSGVVEI